MIRKVVVSAPAKVILFGEHSVLYGSNAIACAIDLRTQVTVELLKTLDEKAQFNLSDDKAIAALEAIKSAIYGLHSPALNVTVKSDIPIGAGLGSSAALCTAFAAALCLLKYEALDNKVLFEMAMVGEKLLHGRASGLDHYTCIHGGLVSFRIKGSPVRLEGPGFQPGKILIIDTNITRNTHQQVSNIVSLLNQDPSKQSCIEELGECAQDFLDMIRSLQEMQLTETIKRAQRNLNELGVSTSLIERVIDRLWERCQIAAKITGAGGGGCLISFPLDPQSHSVVELKNTVRDIIPGAKVRIVEPSINGILVEGIHEENQMKPLV